MSEERNPCFHWAECKFVIFAVFVKTALFAQGAKTPSFLSLIVWISLVNFEQGISLLKWVLSLVFQGFLCVRQGKKVLGNFGGFLGKDSKIKERKGREHGLPKTRFVPPRKVAFDTVNRLHAKGVVLCEKDVFLPSKRLL